MVKIWLIDDIPLILPMNLKNKVFSEVNNNTDIKNGFQKLINDYEILYFFIIILSKFHTLI